MALSDYVNTFGQDLLRRYGTRVHKISIKAGMSCPNRDGSKGEGGCTFCNNASFLPPTTARKDLRDQIARGGSVVSKRMGAHRYLAYFQAYTNTYADVDLLRKLYDEALAHPQVVGLAVGTRPDCLPDPVLDMLAEYRQSGLEVWLELGLQSANDRTLMRVNRGHGFAEYRTAVDAIRARGLPLCTHLIIGLPGEGTEAALGTLLKVTELGVDALKLHPLHVVRGSALADDWRQGKYRELGQREYVKTVATLIEHTPADVLYQRVTGTASAKLLLAPEWCSKKWPVMNAIEQELAMRGGRQGSALGVSWLP